MPRELLRSHLRAARTTALTSRLSAESAILSRAYCAWQQMCLRAVVSQPRQPQAGASQRYQTGVGRRTVHITRTRELTSTRVAGPVDAPRCPIMWHALPLACGSESSCAPGSRLLSTQQAASTHANVECMYVHAVEYFQGAAVHCSVRTVAALVRTRLLKDARRAHLAAASTHKDLACLYLRLLKCFGRKPHLINGKGGAQRPNSRRTLSSSFCRDPEYRHPRCCARGLQWCAR